MKPLQGKVIINIAVNLPGPLTASKLFELGAKVLKVEPPSGDLLAKESPRFYEVLSRGHEIHTLNLKEKSDRSKLDDLLANCDLLISSSRIASLARIGLDWTSLNQRFPKLCQIAIVGYLGVDRAGHDLTYQAEMGFLNPPTMPISFLADITAANDAAFKALGILMERERTGQGQYCEIAIANSLVPFEWPFAFGLTGAGKILGGALPTYNLYRSSNGWIALAALEPHFADQLKKQLQLTEISKEKLTQIFLASTSEEWDKWGQQNDIPLSVVKEMKK